jgi:hypothetical protein
MSERALEPTYMAGMPVKRPQQNSEKRPSQNAFFARLYVSPSKNLSDGDGGVPGGPGG